MVAAWTEILIPLAWALLHFLWQGALIVAATWGALRLLRDHDPRTRYTLACASLAMMAALPAITYWLERASSPAPAPPFLLPLPALASGPSAAPMLVVVLWLAGVVLVSFRHLRAWAVVRQWAATKAVPSPALRQRAGRVAQRLGLSRGVRLVVSTHVDVPTAFGWLRPVVVIPTSAVTGLPAAHLDALLAHEFAHIRRHDYLVNLLQVVVETVLFYHPGVWWVSRQIRLERENCCDDLAVACCGDQRTYLEALAGLETLRSAEPVLSMSAKGGSLVARARRLVSKSPSRSSGPAVFLAVGLLLVSLTAGLYACDSPTKSAQQDGAATASDHPVDRYGEVHDGLHEETEPTEFRVRVELEDGSTRQFTVEELTLVEDGHAVFELREGQTFEWVDQDGQSFTMQGGRVVIDGLQAGENLWVSAAEEHRKRMHELVREGKITKEELEALHRLHQENGTVDLPEISEERMAEIRDLIHGTLEVHPEHP